MEPEKEQETEGDDEEDDPLKPAAGYDRLKDTRVLQETDQCLSSDTVEDIRLSAATFNPVDSGWAWVVLLSSSVTLFVCVGIWKSFGVLFVEVQHQMQATSAQVALLGAVEATVFSLTSVVSLTVLVELVSIRCVVLVGTAVGSAGFVLSFLAYNVSHLILTFAVCLGIGTAMALGASFCMLNFYFRKKLAIATAIANTAASVGSIVMPITTRMLLDYYFLSGTFLLLGGLFAQIFIFAILLTPPNNYKLKTHPCEEDLVSEEKCTVRIDLEIISELTITRHSSKRNKMVCSIRSRRSKSRQTMKKRSHKARTCLKTVRKQLVDNWDRKLLRSTIFWMVAVYHFFAGMCSGMGSYFFPFLAQEKGMSSTQGALLVTLSGVLDIVNKLGGGILIQSKLIGPCLASFISLFINGIMFQLTPLFRDMTSLTVMSLVYGLFAGSQITVMAVLIVEFVDKHQFAKVYGVINLAFGVSGMVGFFVVGYLKDVTGSYHSAFHFMGGCGLVAGCLIILMPYIHRWEKRSSR